MSGGKTKRFSLVQWPLPAIPSIEQVQIVLQIPMYLCFTCSLTQNSGREEYRPCRFSLIHKGGRPEPSSLQTQLWRPLFLLMVGLEVRRNQPGWPPGQLPPSLFGLLCLGTDGKSFKVNVISSTQFVNNLWGRSFFWNRRYKYHNMILIHVWYLEIHSIYPWVRTEFRIIYAQSKL